MRVLDWSDTCWAHPGLDAEHVACGLADEAAARVWRAWTEVWAAAGFEVAEAAIRMLAARVDDAHQLLTYRTPLPAVEDSCTAGGLGGVTAQLRAALAGGDGDAD